MFLSFSPQLGQAVAPMEIGTGAGGARFAATADRTGPAGRRPGQHLLETTRPMLVTGGPQRRRRRGQRRRRAADDFVAEERRRKLGGQMGRKEEGRRWFHRPEASAYSSGAKNFMRKGEININEKEIKIRLKTQFKRRCRCIKNLVLLYVIYKYYTIYTLKAESYIYFKSKRNHQSGIKIFRQQISSFS